MLKIIYNILFEHKNLLFLIFVKAFSSFKYFTVDEKSALYDKIIQPIFEPD
jgi:hypothetical protein